MQQNEMRIAKGRRRNQGQQRRKKKQGEETEEKNKTAIMESRSEEEKPTSWNNAWQTEGNRIKQSQIEGGKKEGNVYVLCPTEYE